MSSRLQVVVLSTLIILGGCAAGYRDVGPNSGDNLQSSGPSSAGLTYQLAGDSNTMYAVSLDAGVWRRSKGDSWHQLAHSSALTTALAVDPSNPKHLVSGDRNNNASQSNPLLFDLSLGGIWESFNSGDTWQLSFTPLTWLANPPLQNSYCSKVQSQAVPVVAFTPSSTILAGTSCGIARKKTTEQAFDLTATPSDIGLVTAIASAPTDANTTMAWALAKRNSDGSFVLMVSTDEGMQWKVIDLPNTVDGFTIPQTDGEPISSAGDLHSLLPFGDSVAMIFKPNPDADNQTGLLYFNLLTNTFSTQLLGSNANNGSGLGGRRSLRTLYISSPYVVGKGMRAFVNTAQDVLEATGIDANGHLIWNHRIRADCAKCEDTDPVHSDIWDVLPSATSSDFWIACDGGVYSVTNQPSMFNDGLSTQHIHNVTVMAPPKSDFYNGALLDYASSDNDAWHRYGAPDSTPAAGWQTYGLQGDSNWVAADHGNSQLSLEVRDTVNADLPILGSNAPSGIHSVGDNLISIACAQGLDKNGNPIPTCVSTSDTPRTWRIIQTGPSSSDYKPNPYLDIIWLATSPLQYQGNGAVVNLTSGSLFNEIKNLSGSIYLLRNQSFAKQPDINSSKFSGWTLENGQVPPGATRIWASMVDPKNRSGVTYYVCACNSVPAQIYKSTGHDQTWTPVPIVVGQATTLQILQILQPSTSALQFSGPLFVDPINPDRLVILTTQGIALSTTGGSSWTLDLPLTALVTASYLYPFANDFPSANGTDVIRASRGLNFMYVSDVAFGWNDDQLAVASPFTGIFYRPATGLPWKNATDALPKPLPAVSSIAFWNTDLYVATEGRSLLETFHLPSATIGTYFDIKRGFRISPSRSVIDSIHLFKSDSSAVADAQVKVTRIGSDGSMTISTSTTDSNGLLPITASLKDGDRVFLSYAGALFRMSAADTAFHNSSSAR